MLKTLIHKLKVSLLLGLLMVGIQSLGQTTKVIVLGIDAPGLAHALELAQPGDEIRIPEGTWPGGVIIGKPLRLVGAGGVIDGGGKGTVLRIEAANVVLEGLEIRGSGTDLRGPDSGVWVGPDATGTQLRRLTISDCTFGIWIHETKQVDIEQNRVIGTLKGHPSNRGNGIHLFDGTALNVRDNYVYGGRDGIYVSATEKSFIVGNTTEHLRFGIHYMYSYNNTVSHNISRDNKIGFALMESRNLIVTHNVAQNNERNGLLFRDAQYCRIEYNRLEHNGEGMFFFSSTDNQIRYNQLAGNEIGVKIWAGSYRNTVVANNFVGNRQQVFFVGAEDLQWGQAQEGNFWSDYLGWDQNGDGLGDRPYRVNSFTSHLLHKYPAASLLMRSPSLELLAHMERSLPLFQVPTVVDRAPLMKEQKHETATSQSN